MTVIKPEMISEKITRLDVLPLSFLKMSPYTGSKRGLRYRMEKTVIPAPEEGGEEKTVLRLKTWRGPFASDCTPPEEMEITDYSFDDAGIDAVIEHLNACLNS